jgi:anti-sigma B factor antagonist
MKITEQQQGAVIVLKPEGPLIETAVEEFKQRVLRTLAGSMGRFIVDMTAVPYLDSAGLEALMDVSEELGKGGQTLRLCAANKTVREVLELTELAAHFDHFGDANTAVRSFL